MEPVSPVRGVVRGEIIVAWSEHGTKQPYSFAVVQNLALAELPGHCKNKRDLLIVRTIPISRTGERKVL